MTHVVYVASTEGQTGKAAVALGLIDSLVSAGKSVGVFRPIVLDPGRDGIGALLAAAPGVGQDPAAALGVAYADAHADLGGALATIIDRFAALDGSYDVVVAVGSDWQDVDTNTELALNARVAANLNAPVVLVVNGRGRSPLQTRQAAEGALTAFAAEHNQAIAVVANRVAAADLEATRTALAGVAPIVAAIPEDAVLSAPTVGAQFAAAGLSRMNGSAERLGRESLATLICGMTLPNVLARLQPESTVVAASDRADLLPGLLTDRAALAKIAGLILVGGYEPPAGFYERARELDPDLPIGTTPEGTFATGMKLVPLFGYLDGSNPRRVEAARRLFAEYVDGAALVDRIDSTQSQIRTPLRFEHQLTAMARANVKTIVLPESADDRILRSAAIVLEKGTAKIILLGDRATIDARAAELGIDVAGATVVSPDDPALVERFAEEYARLRAKKGVTLEQARATLRNLSYFATMMIHVGMADGMVSGAINTTADTIKPSFEFIKTKPGVGVVSSSFLMCMADRVLVFGDCAVNPNPNPEQLADIAIGCAGTARRFGIEPRVAMLSYSTGTSGKGEDVDAVAEATRIAREKAPDLALDGPIQFDAAVDAAVGWKKLPGSPVAGQATVLIFPDLNAGNNTYKAVQRSSGALAIGPVLQGLNKPVNDLSRGALVDDIVNTIAITAIQAQDDATTEGAPK